MKASREWGPCSCDCGEHIKAGCEIVMKDGAMYLAGHENNRRTRQMPVIPMDLPTKKQKKS